MSNTNDIILEVKGLKQYFLIRAGFFQKVVGHIKAVDGVSFSIHEEEIFGLVGESGCGKTTLGRSILRLYDPTAGEIWFRKKNGERVEISHLINKAMKPLHPYTEALISAIPPADPDTPFNQILLSGEVPSPANPPTGCVFHTRCRYAEDICRQEEPDLVEVKPNHAVSCHFVTELNLKGIGG